MGTTAIVNRITQRYSDALKGPLLTVASLAQVWSGEVAIATFNPDPGCHVTVDRNNANRRVAAAALRGGLNADGTTIVPRGATGIFTPFGNELRMYRGIAYADGTGDVELVCQGVFGMEDVSVNDAGKDLLVTLSGSDRSKAVTRAGLVADYIIPPNINGGTALRTFLASLPVGFSMQFNFAPISFSMPSTPTVLAEGGDPWALAVAIAATFGCELFFDRNGVCVLQPVPDPRKGGPVWSFDEGPANNATNLTRHLSRKLADNYMIRVGSGTGIAAPVRAVASDTNPLSPTNVNGSYGRQVNRQTSSLYTTQAQAQAAADADLILALGQLETIDVDMLTKPDWDVSDVFELTRARAGIAAENFVTDSFTIGFTTDVLLQVTRARAVH